jgi:hypothetical protein
MMTIWVKLSMVNPKNALMSPGRNSAACRNEDEVIGPSPEQLISSRVRKTAQQYTAIV